MFLINTILKTLFYNMLNGLDCRKYALNYHHIVFLYSQLSHYTCYLSESLNNRR